MITRDKVRLVDLPGLKANAIFAARVRSVSGAIRALRDERAITASGEKGALNVWRDDRMVLRMQFMRYRITVDAAEATNLAAARRWLRKWWPELGLV